jgi:hypothetical protein
LFQREELLTALTARGDKIGVATSVRILAPPAVGTELASLRD